MDFGLAEDDRDFQRHAATVLDGVVHALEPELAARKEALFRSPLRVFSHEFAAFLDRAVGFRRRLAEAGLVGVGWPVDYGGQGRSALQQWLFMEELARRRLPTGGLTVTSIGPTLIRLGSEEQKRDLLPAILDGEVEFAVGYSEPNAGTDLAAIETRASRDGDGYLIQGQKIYTTGAHYATHLWLAVRTGPADSRHRGLSVFIVPANTRGVTVTPLNTQADLRTNQVFLDAVRVPAGALVGEENAGWLAMMVALDFERLNWTQHAALAADVEDFLREAGPGADPQLAGRLLADLEVARLFGVRAAHLTDRGVVPSVEAAMGKIWISELRRRIADETLSLSGEAGQLALGEAAAPLGGSLEHLYRFFPVTTFAGGNNEVLRGVVAERGLGLARA